METGQGVPDPVVEAQKYNMLPRQGLHEFPKPCSLPKLPVSQRTFQEIIKIALLAFLMSPQRPSLGCLSLYASLDVLELAT